MATINDDLPPLLTVVGKEEQESDTKEAGSTFAFSDYGLSSYLQMGWGNIRHSLSSRHRPRSCNRTKEANLTTKLDDGSRPVSVVSKK